MMAHLSQPRDESKLSDRYSSGWQCMHIPSICLPPVPNKSPQLPPLPKHQASGKTMHIQQRIHALRSDLYQMSELSKRAVDYSIKAFELGSQEFCRIVSRVEHELDELQHGITDLYRELIVVGLPVEVEAGLVWCALRVYGAIHAKSPAFETTGRLVNRLVRLSTTALCKEEVHRAETVLQSRGVERRIRIARLSRIRWYRAEVRRAGQVRADDTQESQPNCQTNLQHRPRNHSMASRERPR